MSKGDTSSKTSKAHRPAARVPKGFRDISAATVRAEARMLARIREVYEHYGFDPLETSAVEYADALGKFLPDEDRPNEGVFAFQDDDEQWMALRYDLTAPLARYVAEHFDGLPKPFRRYQVGPVWRNEKPGPGRFRQFTQFDADTVGTPTVAADAEMCMMAADCFEALGISRGAYRLRVNNRKVLDGLLETIGIAGDEEAAVNQRMTVLRSIDKFDKLGRSGVELLLGAGRKDESGDFTKGAGLEPAQIASVLDYVESGLEADGTDRVAVLEGWRRVVGASARGNEGIDELLLMNELFDAAGYGVDRIEFNSWIVRGLGYYTGPVFESELLFEVKDEKGNPVRFGSVGSGGRYDGLVERFKGVKVPATGFSIGVSRLYTALDLLGQISHDSAVAPVVVLVLGDLAASQSMVRDLRDAGIRAEMYLGGSGMRAQVKYADRRGAPVAVIEGEDERAQGIVTLKDLILGAEMSREIEDNAKWREGQPAQVSVPRAELVQAVRDILARHGLHTGGN